MLGKVFSQLKKKNGATGKSGSALYDPAEGIGKVSKFLSASGRISLAHLRKLAQEFDGETFMDFLHQPVLAGSAIQAGRIAEQENKMSRDSLNSTQIFEPSSSLGNISTSEGLSHAIYPLIKGEYSTSSRKIFSVGRIDGNDMIIPDYAISKKHAIIQIEGGKYYIEDAGSTNGTSLNGERLDSQKRARLNDKDIISFARYEFTFLLPDSLYRRLRGF